MAYGVKLRAPHERRFMFLAAKGATTWLRVRALRFELEESAHRHAETVQRDHPKLKEWDWKVVTLLGGY